MDGWGCGHRRSARSRRRLLNKGLRPGHSSGNTGGVCLTVRWRTVGGGDGGRANWLILCAQPPRPCCCPACVWEAALGTLLLCLPRSGPRGQAPCHYALNEGVPSCFREVPESKTTSSRVPGTQEPRCFGPASVEILASCPVARPLCRRHHHGRGQHSSAKLGTREGGVVSPVLPTGRKEELRLPVARGRPENQSFKGVLRHGGSCKGKGGDYE